MKSSLKPAVFFDRDGILVQSVNGEAPIKADDMQLIPEAIPIIKRLQKKGVKTFVVSNQPDVAFGHISEQEKEKLVKKFEDLLKVNNLNIDQVYYCFHHKDGSVKKYRKDCSCHKPKPGMLLKAQKTFNLDMGKSFIVGDRTSDIVAGKKAGVKTILMDPDNAQNDYLTLHGINPDYTIKRIEEALKIII